MSILDCDDRLAKESDLINMGFILNQFTSPTNYSKTIIVKRYTAPTAYFTLNVKIWLGKMNLTARWYDGDYHHVNIMDEPSIQDIKFHMGRLEQMANDLYKD